jgi:hypothetical protein
MALRDPGRGYVWLAMCDKCGHASGLPVRLLLARYGELCPVEQAMFHFRCAERGEQRVSAKLARLCDPGCGRQRG